MNSINPLRREKRSLAPGPPPFFMDKGLEGEKVPDQVLEVVVETVDLETMIDMLQKWT